MVEIAEEKKKRVTLWLEESAIAAGKKLAKADNRSLNNFVETLFQRAAGLPPEARKARLSVKHKKAGAK